MAYIKWGSRRKIRTANNKYSHKSDKARRKARGYIKRIKKAQGLFVHQKALSRISVSYDKDNRTYMPFSYRRRDK